MDNRDRQSLRVLIACSSRKWIGEAAHCLALCERLAERGHVPLLVVREGWDLEARARDAGMKAVALRFRSRFSPFSDWHDVRRLAHLVRRQQQHADQQPAHQKLLHGERNTRERGGAEISAKFRIDWESPTQRCHPIYTEVRALASAVAGPHHMPCDV